MVCLQWVMIGYWLPSLKEMPNWLFHWITTWPSLTRWANYLSPCPRQAHLLSGRELMILEASWPMRCCGMFLEVFPGNQSSHYNAHQLSHTSLAFRMNITACIVSHNYVNFIEHVQIFKFKWIMWVKSLYLATDNWWATIFWDHWFRFPWGLIDGYPKP